LPNVKEIGNSWTVPYNVYLLLKYICNIIVLVCISVNLVKYLYTYNFKGGDSLTWASNCDSYMNLERERGKKDHNERHRWGLIYGRQLSWSGIP
jgi:hypothetical protein